MSRYSDEEREAILAETRANLQPREAVEQADDAHVRHFEDDPHEDALEWASAAAARDPQSAGRARNHGDGGTVGESPADA